MTLNLTIIGQDRLNIIELTDSSIKMGNNLIYKSHVQYIWGIRNISELFLKEKFIEKRDRDFNTWNYYAINSGFELICSGKNEDVDQLNVYFKKSDLTKKSIRRKMGTYKGTIVLNSIEISKSSTFGEIKKSLQEKCCHEIKSKSIDINYDGIYFKLFFDGVEDKSEIKFFYINW